MPTPNRAGRLLSVGEIQVPSTEQILGMTPASEVVIRKARRPKTQLGEHRRIAFQ
jgi:hypothetical protein